MPAIWIPTLLKYLTNGVDTVEIEGKNIRELIESLDLTYPGIKSRLCDDNDKIRAEIAVAVDGQIVTTGMRTRVTPDSHATISACMRRPSSSTCPRARYAHGRAVLTRACPGCHCSGRETSPRRQS